MTTKQTNDRGALEGRLRMLMNLQDDGDVVAGVASLLERVVELEVDNQELRERVEVLEMVGESGELVRALLDREVAATGPAEVPVVPTVSDSAIEDVECVEEMRVLVGEVTR